MGTLRSKKAGTALMDRTQQQPWSTVYRGSALIQGLAHGTAHTVRNGGTGSHVGMCSQTICYAQVDVER